MRTKNAGNEKAATGRGFENEQHSSERPRSLSMRPHVPQNVCSTRSAAVGGCAYSPTPGWSS